MDNLEKYNRAFIETLEIEESQLGNELLYESVTGWDSVGHMQLMAQLEDEFDIMIETDDIINFSSYEKGKEILAKYEVKI